MLDRSRLEFLRQTELFESLPDDQIAAIAQIAQVWVYRKGDPIFFEGDPCPGFFVVRSGRVKVFKTSADGKEQILHWFETGDRFADVPAFDGGCYPASAAALVPTELLLFPSSALRTLLQEDATLALNLLAAMSRHLRRFAQLIDALSLKEIPSRLAGYLLQTYDRQQEGNPSKTAAIELDLSKGQLAAFLGTIPETLSRTFAKLVRANLIEIDGARIEIRDREGLARLASGDTRSLARNRR